MAWNSGLLVSIPLSISSGEGFLSPSSHSHCRMERNSEKNQIPSPSKNALLSSGQGTGSATKQFPHFFWHITDFYFKSVDECPVLSGFQLFDLAKHV